MNVSPGRMPGKLMPGTPSMWNGTINPCQWIDVSSFSRLCTTNWTFCPSFNRMSGAGKVPLMVTAWAERPPVVK